MKTVAVLFVLSACVPALATTYTVNAGSSTDTIQNTIHTAGIAPGNTVVFSAGTYNLAYTITLPCSNGTIYTGPKVGVVTQKNLPTAVLSSAVSTNYAFSTDSNNTSLTGAQGCMIEYLRFSGTQGGILVYYPASGITIQQNAFDNNNPPAGGNSSQANIFLTGQNWNLTAATGVSHISIVWNTFFSNCAAIRAAATIDSGGGCASTWVDAFNDHLTWSNNTVNLTEQGLKLSQQQVETQGSLNADVENNNMQGNSRILIEAQQETNGISTYSHNAFYQPFNPGFNTFELSLPQWTGSTAPTHTVDDNVMVGNVPVTIGGSGAHYGIGLELWGPGSIATNNLFQGGNGADTCAAGFGCSGWGITIGGTFTNAIISGNYFSGTGVWAGSSTNLGNAVTYEQDSSSSNSGLVLSQNTVVQTSQAIPVMAPTIASSSNTVTIRDSDSKHLLSFFYTTDGSAPAIFPPGGSAGTSRVYSAPFTVTSSVMVKAVAAWGQGANQGIIFPSFGYVPSSVVTAAAGLSQVLQGRVLVGGYLSAKGNSNTVVVGGTLQFTGYGTYSDGTSGVLPDAQGNKVTWWNTTNHQLAKVSSLGNVTALAAGVVNIKAMVGPVVLSPWTVTVGTVQNPAVTGAAVSGAIPAAPGAALPDTFLGPFWRLVTPTGGSASISNSHLFLGVPRGANHDPLHGNNQAVRVVQAIGNQDFDVAIKIDSPLFAGDANTSQGLMVLSSNQSFLIFALTTDGTKIGLSAEIVANGSVTTVLEDSDFSEYQNPIYLRLTRARSAYVAFVSIDGVSWKQVASFTDTTATTWVGPFASNYNSNPADAVPVVMSVNWFDVLQ